LRSNIALRLFKGFICILLCFCLCGCYSHTDEISHKDRAYSGGIWFTYLEIEEMLKSDKGFKRSFSEALDNCERVNISDIYLHTRAFCDSIYPSAYFPETNSSKNFDGDILSFATEECHKRGMRIHAWINPYRISNQTSDIENIDKNSPAYIWLHDNDKSNDRFVSFTQNGIYLNPCENEARRLVINGIREILLNYKVDGIHFDDYFYPTKEGSFDAESYAIYTADNQSPLPLDEWRRANVNTLISSSYTAIKFISKDIIFSISPAASIEKNFSDLYADVAAWAQNCCIDYIMPQIYFGFSYPADEYKFQNLISVWEDFSKAHNTPLVIGLAAYKIGSKEENDIEWSENNDILSKQIKFCKQSENIKGYCFFSYSSLFSNADRNEQELNNILKELSNEQ